MGESFRFQLDGREMHTCAECGAALEEGEEVRCEPDEAGAPRHYRLVDGEQVPRHIVAFVDVR